MKTIVYQNYDETCPYFHLSRYDPFGDCINPIVYNILGFKNNWVTSCFDCSHRSLVTEEFNYKVAVLGIKLEEAFGNGFKGDSG